MLALQFKQTGSLEQLKLEDLPSPDVKSGNVLIKVKAAAINPSDVKNVLGKMSHTTVPRIPGRDFAGVVIEGSSNLVGLEVWGTGGELGFTRDGTHAEFISLPEAAVKPKPKNLSLEESAAIGVVYVTAFTGIERAALSEGETLLVIGATGGVGGAAMRIAKWRGAKTIGTIRRDSDAETAVANGADLTINLQEQDLTEAVMSATNGKGADVVFDTVGGSLFEQCLPTLGSGGRIIEISASAGKSKVSFDLLDFYRRDLKLIGVNTLHLDAMACAEVLQKLTSNLEGLSPSIDIGATYSLEEAVTAYQQVNDRKVKGTVLITSK